MKNLFLIFLLFSNFYIAMAKDFIVSYYGHDFEGIDNILQLNHDLNHDYRSIIRQLAPQYRNQFVQVQQKWMRYITHHCAHSNECQDNATSIQINNLDALISGEINIKKSNLFTIQYDNDGEISQHSYNTISELMLERYQDELNTLDKSEQTEYQEAYEIYHAYLFDYCELLNNLTQANFLNCTVKGLLDFQYHVSL